MRYIIIGKNINVTDALKEKVQDKLNRLEKFFLKDTEVHVTLATEKISHIIEVTIPVKGNILRAEESGTDMYAAIDEVVDVLERQILKYRKKLQDNVTNNKSKSKNPFNENFMAEDFNDDEDEDIKIVKNKRFNIKPMDAKEAALQMDLVGHSFFVFRNAENDDINVVYKRKDGSYGLIEPEF